MRKPILIYHKNCPDGFGSAFAFWLKHGDKIEYCPVSHSTERFFGLNEEDLVGRNICMADIAFDREDLIFLTEHAKKITVLDHHKTAMKKSGDLDCCYFDMDHSGAILAWNFCFPGEEPPKILRYIEDRDLWKFELPYASEILAAIDSYDMSFEIWQDLMERINDPDKVAGILREGNAILRYNEILMKRIKRSTYYADIKGYRVPIINTPFFRSEILADLAKNNPFSAGYNFDGENFYFSLRADGENPESIDVSEIASSFPGGGGHRNAAGFSIKELRDLDS